jgi:hypothetical protein
MRTTVVSDHVVKRPSKQIADLEELTPAGTYMREGLVNDANSKEGESQSSSRPHQRFHMTGFT